MAESKWTQAKDRNSLIEPLIKMLHDHSKLDEKGEFVGFDFNKIDSREVIDNLSALVDYSEDLPHIKGEEFLRSAVHNAARNNRLSSGAIIQEVRNAESNYLSKPLQSQYLLTSMSIKYFDDLKKIIFEDTSIRFFRTLPKGFSQDHFGAEDILYPIKAPEYYTWVKVHVKTRCEHSAFVKALDTLDLLRGIWNLSLDRRRRIMFLGVRPQPANSIVLGPIHTLHDRHGSPITHVYQWEPNYVQPQRLQELVKDYSNLRYWELKRRRCFQRSPYANYIRNTIIQYARALDEANSQTALMKLWSVLERATLTRSHEGNDVTVRRASFFFDNKRYHTATLQRLRLNRNQFVHEGIEILDSQDSLYKLRKYVIYCIDFLIQLSTKFEGLDEYRGFLDLPNDSSKIRNLEKRLKKEDRWVRLYKALKNEV